MATTPAAVPARRDLVRANDVVESNPTIAYRSAAGRGLGRDICTGRFRRVRRRDDHFSRLHDQERPLGRPDQVPGPILEERFQAAAIQRVLPGKRDMGLSERSCIEQRRIGVNGLRIHDGVQSGFAEFPRKRPVLLGDYDRLRVELARIGSEGSGTARHDRAHVPIRPVVGGKSRLDGANQIRSCEGNVQTQTPR